MLEGEEGVAHTLSSPIAKIKHGKWKHVFISQNKTCLSKKRKHLKNLKCEFSRIQLKIIGRLDLFGVACTALAGVGRGGWGSINQL